MTGHFLKNKNLRFVSFLVVIAVLLFTGRFFQIEQTDLKSFLESVPQSLSGVIFIIIYVVLTTLIWLGPKDVLRILAAIFYGPYVSTLLVFIGEMFNAVVLFTLSRRMGREFVEGKLKKGTKHLDEAIAETGFWWIFFMRVFLFPFRMLDLGFGLTKISLAKYMLIIFIASPVRIFLFQYLLSLGKDIYMNPDALAQHLSTKPFMLWLSFGYVIGAILILFVFRKFGSRIHRNVQS